ncbi:hypothetical protein [Oribacterium sp. oral taxon 078]|uniref:hypothetical protein n=1 Tax=Oribacterium sp. oral taxon 078 TaxID=652706 RepID=UPI0012DD99D9|nr:hypothetical protein [Oribacterium sp. oral taxon 078]
MENHEKQPLQQNQYIPSGVRRQYFFMPFQEAVNTLNDRLCGHSAWKRDGAEGGYSRKKRRQSEP